MSAPSTIRLGAFTIHRIVEMEMPFLTIDEMFPNSTPAEVDALLPRLQPWCVDAERRVLVAIQAYLVKTPDELILLDTCVGCDKTNKRFDFWHKRTDRLVARAVQGDRLWSKGGNHRPLLASAHRSFWVEHTAGGRALGADLPKRDLHFLEAGDSARDGRRAGSLRESVKPVIEAGHARLIDIGHHGPEEFLRHRGR